MGEWYWIGVAVGLGAAAGVLVAGLFGGARRWLPVTLLIAAAAGAGIGYAVGGWIETAAGAAGAAAGAIGGSEVALGTMRRGGTRVGTALLFAGGALALAGLAWVPALGYVEAVVLPVLGLRLRRRAPGRYEGLRILARD